MPYAAALYVGAQAAGLRPRITSVRRSRQQQAVLYDRYRRGLSQFPAAPPGQSRHERGLAFDMVTVDGGRAAGAAWNEAGGFWSPSDWVHYEVR